MFLKPKALLRVRGEEQIPGEPALTPEGEKELKAMIDAPIGAEREKWRPRWPKGLENYTIPFGQGKIVREGTDLTVVSYGRTLPICAKVADEVKSELGLSVEVIDLRSLWPYDWTMISNSILKTRKVIFVNEDTEVTNFGEHLLRRAVEEHFYDLEARPRLLAGEFVPGVGLADTLEMASVPQHHSIKKIILEVAEEKA